MDASSPVQCDQQENLVDAIVHQVASDLELENREHLDIQIQLHKAYIRTIPALKESVHTGRLFEIVHPFIAERIAERVFEENSGFVDFEAESEPCCDISNPSKFKNAAVFVHRISPIAGTLKGRIICTWALDVSEDTRVIHVMERLASYLSLELDCLRLIFNGIQLRMTNTLSDYDIRGGDTLYLYTLQIDDGGGTCFSEANSRHPCCCQICGCATSSVSRCYPQHRTHLSGQITENCQGEAGLSVSTGGNSLVVNTRGRAACLPYSTNTSYGRPCCCLMTNFRN